MVVYFEVIVWVVGLLEIFCCDICFVVIFFDNIIVFVFDMLLFKCGKMIEVDFCCCINVGIVGDVLFLFL